MSGKLRAFPFFVFFVPDPASIKGLIFRVIGLFRSKKFFVMEEGILIALLVT